MADCAVISDQVLSFVMRNLAEGSVEPGPEEHEVRKLVVWYKLDPKAAKTTGCSEIGNAKAILSLRSENPDRLLYICRSGIILTYDLKKDAVVQEAPIYKAAEGPGNYFQVTGARNVNGRAYVLGPDGTVLLRHGPGRWDSISVEKNTGDDRLLVDIDGFAADDLYAVSSRGSVFHYNGQSWSDTGFPSNISLESLCCAGDGQVYIGAAQGTVFRGRGQRWEKIHDGSLTLPFRDMVWHQGQVWCTNDFGLWVIRGGQLAPAEVERDIYVCSGHLSVHENTLLLAGMYGAAILREGRWEALFYQPEFIEEGARG